MIEITDKKNCCGCEACINICPKTCISATIDDEGFVYPHVDTDKCVDCHLCEHVCPVLAPYEPHQAISSSAAWIKDEATRLESSSGGIFTELAEWIVKQGGVVYGASFDDRLRLRHTKGDSARSIEQFRGSKYLQSRSGDIYKDVKEVLGSGRPVLYTGTGCQISGLKHYLKKDYSNLITLEVMCHGTPSPKVWESYLKYVVGGKHKHVKVSFRDKRHGWKMFGLSIDWKGRFGNKNFYRPNTQDPYMKCFLRNITLRPSCYDCATRDGRSGADIIVGDFWGIDRFYPEIDDNKGCSAVIAYTKKGEEVLNGLNLNRQPVKYDEILSGNPVLKKSVSVPNNRIGFWMDFNSTDSIKKRYQIMCQYGLGYRETTWHTYKSKYLDIKERVIAKLKQILNK